MKKVNPILFTFFIGLLTYSFVNSEKSISISKHQSQNYNSSGKSGNYSGAPNEANCTQCHSGTTQSGNGVNDLLISKNGSAVTSYIPGETYTVTLSTTESNVTKGFQAVAMNNSNQVSGSVLAITNECAQVTSGRVTHNQSDNTSCNSKWKWEWTAPSTDEGELTFYVATLIGNGVSTSGDQVYLSQHSVGGVLGVTSISLNDRYKFNAGYVAEKKSVSIKFNTLSKQQMFFNLVDLNGKSIYSYRLGNSNIGDNTFSVRIPSDIKDGMYVVNFFLHNDVLTKKVFITN